MRQLCKEQFVDNAFACDAHRTLLFRSWMGGHHHAAREALGADWHVWTIVEAADDPALRTLLELISRQVQTCLNQRVIEHAVLLAAGHKREPSHIGEDGSGAILPVEPQQGARSFELRRREIAPNGQEPLAQFLPVPPVATMAKRAEPLVAMGLSNRGARANHLPAFAARVSRSAPLIQPTIRRRKFIGLR